VLSGSLSQLEKMLSECERQQALKTKKAVKSALRIKNVGVDAKRYQEQLDLQRDCHLLLATINELSERNTLLVKRHRKRLHGFERELCLMLLAIQRL